jgi:hypothetical protein
VKRPLTDETAPLAIRGEDEGSGTPVVHYHFPVEIEVRTHTAAEADPSRMARELAEQLTRALRSRG